jgi:hypothetical protein
MSHAAPIPTRARLRSSPFQVLSKPMSLLHIASRLDLVDPDDIQSQLCVLDAMEPLILKSAVTLRHLPDTARDAVSAAFALGNLLHRHVSNLPPFLNQTDSDCTEHLSGRTAVMQSALAALLSLTDYQAVCEWLRDADHMAHLAGQLSALQSRSPSFSAVSEAGRALNCICTPLRSCNARRGRSAASDESESMSALKNESRALHPNNACVEPKTFTSDAEKMTSSVQVVQDQNRAILDRQNGSDAQMQHARGKREEPMQPNDLPHLQQPVGHDHRGATPAQFLKTPDVLSLSSTHSKAHFLPCYRSPSVAPAPASQSFAQPHLQQHRQSPQPDPPDLNCPHSQPLNISCGAGTRALLPCTSVATGAPMASFMEMYRRHQQQHKPPPSSAARRTANCVPMPATSCTCRGEKRPSSHATCGVHASALTHSVHRPVRPTVPGCQSTHPPGAVGGSLTLRSVAPTQQGTSCICCAAAATIGENLDLPAPQTRQTSVGMEDAEALATLHYSGKPSEPTSHSSVPCPKPQDDQGQQNIPSSLEASLLKRCHSSPLQVSYLQAQSGSTTTSAWPSLSLLIIEEFYRVVRVELHAMVYISAT